jgi:protein gp37
VGENSAISWTDNTFNPWVGCTKVGPGCDHCYAEADFDHRKHWVTWGAGNPRRRTSASTWNNPIRWNREAAKTGVRPRVFCASLADVFDNEVPPEWRADLWDVIRATPLLRWMQLTKRIGNVMKMAPPDWPFPHAGVMATIVNQEEWDRDFPKLMSAPAPWRRVSMEPLLGPIDISRARPEWVITGGESGPRARPIDPEWCGRCATSAPGTASPSTTSNGAAGGQKTTAASSMGVSIRLSRAPWRRPPDDRHRIRQGQHA